jgi:hypothetical protein
MILVQTSQLLQSLLAVLPVNFKYLHFVPRRAIAFSVSSFVNVKSVRSNERKELQSCLHNLQALEVKHHEERRQLR